MTEHPGETATGAGSPPDDGPDGESAGSTEAVEPRESSDAEEQPDAAAEAPESEEPDALGHVEEQTRVPEEQSTVSQPGEALDELLPALASTGHDGVDDALATLDEMAEKSVHDHVDVFDAVHEELRRTLDQAADQ